MQKQKNLIQCFSFFFLMIFLTTCKEEVITLSPPKIDITSVEEIAFGKFVVNIEINHKKKQQIKYAELLLEDITLNSSNRIIKEIPITEELNQIVSVQFDNAAPNHDYKAYAKIITNEYEYSSEIIIIRASKNNFSLEILENDLYVDYENNISDIVTRVESFTCLLYFQSDIQNKEVKIKLNKKIELDHNLTFNGYYVFNTQKGKYISGTINLPMNIEPGDYEVYAYLDGIEIKAATKIRILKDFWIIYDDSFPGRGLVERSWFVIRDELFLTGGAHMAGAGPFYFDVWKFSLKDKMWTKMNDFPYSNTEEVHTILPRALSYENKGYAALRKRDQIVELWEYDLLTDSWSFLTRYPQKAYGDLNFIIDNKLFVGLRLDETENNNYYTYQVWSFDFESKTWEQLTDLPKTINAHRPSCCSLNGKGYVLEAGQSNRLWEYNPDNDTWKLMPRFPGIKRSESNIVGQDDKIYLIGGKQDGATGDTFTDCWSFSVSENTWSLSSFFSNRSQNGIAFCWDKKIIYGMGYYHNWDLTYSSSLQELTSNL